MKPVDDEIMELLLEQGGATPKSLASDLSKNNDYVGTRCRELKDYGLLDRPAVGLYRLTDNGRDYLSGDLDASELEEAES